MPRLPDLNSIGVVDPAAGQAQVPYGFERSAGRMGEAVAGVGEQISRTAARVGGAVLARQKDERDKQDRLNYVTANSAFLQDSVKTQSDLEADPSSYANWTQAYETRAKQVADAQAATITDPALRAQFLASAGLHAAETSAGLRLKARAQKVDADKAYALGTIDATMQSIFKPGVSDAAREYGLKTMSDAIAGIGPNGTGSLSAVEEQALRKQATDNYVKAWAASFSDPHDLMNALAGKPGSGLPPAPLPADIKATVETAATAHGINPADLERGIQIESGGKNIPPKPGHKAAGVAQFIPETAAAYSVNPMDVGSSIDGMARLWADNRAQLKKDLGREPTGAEIYLAHQQGAAGANALIQNPDSKAATVVPEENILGNGGTPGMTAKQFVDMWAGKFNNAPAKPPTGEAPTGEPDLPRIAHTGTPADLLPPGERFQLYRGAEAAVRAQDAQDRAEAERQRQAAKVELLGKVDDTLAAIRDTGKDPNSLTPADLSAGFTPAEVETIWRKRNREMDFWTVRQRVGMAGPAEEQALLESVKGKPDEPGYADRLQNYDLMVKAIDAKHKLLASDPAAYVMQASPDIAQALRDGFTDPSKMRDAVRQLDGAYDRLAVPQQHREVLSEEAAKGLVEQLRSSSPGDLGNTINQMASQYGPDVWPRVLGSMVREGKLPASYEVVAAVNDPVARGALVEGLADPEKVRAAVPKNDLKTIDNQIDTDPDLHRLAASFAYAPGGAQKVAEIKQAVALMAYRLAPRNSPDAAVKTAIASITTGKYDFLEDGDYVARVPAGHLADVETRTSAAIEALKASDLMPLEPSLAVPALTAGQRQDVALAAAQRGHWVTNESETGLVRLNEAGKPVMLKGDVAHPLRRLEVFFGDTAPTPVAAMPPPAAVGGGSIIPPQIMQ